MAALAKSKERPLVLENCFAAPFLAACSTLSNLRRGSHKSAALLYSFKNSSRGSQFFRTHQGRLSWVAVHHHKRTRWRGMQPPLKTMGTNPWIHLEKTVSLESRIFNLKHIVWKLLIMTHLNFWISAFSTNFCPTKTDLSGNTVWPQASGFQKLVKMDHFWHF